VLGAFAIAAFVTEVSLFSFARGRIDTKAVALVAVITGAALLIVDGTTPRQAARPTEREATAAGAAALAGEPSRQWAVCSTGSGSLASCRTFVANRSIDTSALTTSALRTSNGIE
jgi:hypothetical protein